MPRGPLSALFLPRISAADLNAICTHATPTRTHYAARCASKLASRHRQLSRAAGCAHVLQVMQEMGERVQERDIDRMMKNVDMDGNGVIDYKEFAQVVTQEMRQGGFSVV